MEESEIKNELLNEIEEEIEHQDKLITLFLLKDKTQSFVLDKLTNELNLSSFEDFLCSKYANLNITNEERYRHEDNEIVWPNIREDDNYEELLSSLTECSSLSLEMLDELIKIHFIDTRQSYWFNISKKLQDCFCLDNSLFLKSLKIFYKIIMTQNCCIYGYLSLLKATNRMVQDYFLGKCKEEINHRVLLCIRIILSTELFMLKTLHTGNDKVIEETVENLILLFSSKTDIQEKNITMLDFISVIDEKAEWFKNLCSSGFTKPMMLQLLGKYPKLLKLIFKNFLSPLNDTLYSLNNHLDKSIHCHSCYFLVYYFNINENIGEFELKIIESKTYNFVQLIKLIVNTLNDNISSEIGETLKNFIVLLFETNPSFMNHEILEILFIPFENIMRGNYIRVISNNMYIFKLIQLSVKNNNKILTDSYLYNKRKYKGIFHFGQTVRNMSADKNFVNMPQLIINITIQLMRNYISTSEKKQSVDENILLLLECCSNIYHSHPVFLHNALTSKFIITLSSFYKTLTNFQTTPTKIEIVLNIFSFFLKYYNILRLFRDKIFVVNILNSVISRKIGISSSMIFNNFSNEIFIEDELQILLHLVAQSFLLSAWSQENSDENIENILGSKLYIDLIHFLYGLSHSMKIIRILVTRCHNLDFIKNGVISIPTMLKLSVQNVKNDLETYTGLLFMRIFITNLDGFLFLQANFGLRDNLAKVLSQIDYHSENEYECCNPDAFIMIRKNLMMNLDSVGYPNKLLNNFRPSVNPQNSRTTIWGIKSGNNCDLQKFLHNTKAAVHDDSWMYQVKTLFYKFCSQGYKVSVVYEIISRCPKRMQKKPARTWPEPGMSLPQLCEEDLVAISIIVRFGLQNQLLAPGYGNEENLALLVKESRMFLSEQTEEFAGFDWFIGICFLVCSGNIERCKNFCVSISQLPSVNLVWHKYGRIFGNVWLDNFLQHLDVLMAENTILYTALKIGNLNLTMVMGKWLSQCFFNLLDFREICNFIIFSVLSPLECSMYYMLCLFLHNKSSICKITHTPCLDSLLNVISLDDFKLISYIPTINELSSRYKNIIKL